MSLTLLAAMAKSKSPEIFVEKFLLPALRTRKIPSAMVSLRGGKPPEKLIEFNEKLGKGDYAQITFVDRNDPRRVCYLKISRMELKRPSDDPNRKEPTPTAKLFKKPYFYVGREDFANAIKKTGVERLRFNGKISKTSSAVLFPRKLLEHGEWIANLRETQRTRLENSIDVLIDPKVYEKLESHERIENFFHEYLATIAASSGKISNADYAALLKYRPKLYEKYKSHSAYQIFHKSQRYNAGLMKEISNATSEKQIRLGIEKHLGVRGPFSKIFARKIYGISKSRGGKLAIDRIAQHAEQMASNILIPKDPSKSVVD
ncbi:hypothetical protein HY989_03780 [Candidatus Micrarchaeota archaeon]|nr:hypothetical protein [Candidatus Micrarchaeota archaeon]